MVLKYLDIFVENSLSNFPYIDNFLRLNWTSGNMNCDIADFRIWKEALSQDTIQAWINKIVDGQHPSFEDLLVYYQMSEFSNGCIKNKYKDNYCGFMIGSPQIKSYDSDKLVIDQEKLGIRPFIGFIEGEYETHKTEEIVTIEKGVDLRKL
jgi:hypothetical protein